MAGEHYAITFIICKTLFAKHQFPQNGNCSMARRPKPKLEGVTVYRLQRGAGSRGGPKSWACD